MSRGHGVIINLSSYLPFIFTFNPVEIQTNKKINYIVAPNIGGAYKKRYFAGFDAKEVSFTLHCVDTQSPLGVKNSISYFEQLRNPDPGLIGLANSFFGNENYPPPQILFQFGVSYVPLVWDVLSVSITAKGFTKDGHIRGIIGIPTEAHIELTLSLDEEHVLNKANVIAEKAGYIVGSAESILVEGLYHKGLGRKKGAPWQKEGSLIPKKRIKDQW